MHAAALSDLGPRRGRMARPGRLAALALLRVLELVVLPCAHAAAPQLHPFTNVLANHAPLNPGSQAIPCVADWNGDGRPDLLVGYQPAFKVALYTNSGSTALPEFTTSANLQAGGVDIYHWSTGCGSPAPYVTDYDGDGRRDLLVGAGFDGAVHYYRNTNTDARPVLASGVPVTLRGSPLSVGLRATPCVDDWDEDGRPDLLCGDGNGNVHFFRNVGSRAAPAYDSDLLLQAGGQPVNFGIRSAVRVLDWDADGRKDLVGSGSGTAAWCRNLTGGAAPQLDLVTRLQAPAAAGGLVSIDNGSRMRLEVCDWNGDGLADLLIGSWDGYLYFYEAYAFGFRELRTSAPGQVTLRWNSSTPLRYDVLGGTSPTALTTALATNLPAAGRDTSWTTDSSGVARYFLVRVRP